MTATVSSDPTRQVDDDDIRGILSYTGSFVRDVAVPRDQEIDETDAIPADVRSAAKDMTRTATLVLEHPGRYPWYRSRGYSGITRPPTTG